MRGRPADTDPDAYELQFALLRHAPLARRLQLALSLSDTVSRLARQAFRRANPAASHEEIGLRFIETHYGSELAEAVRQDLAARRG